MPRYLERSFTHSNPPPESEAPVRSPPQRPRFAALALGARFRYSGSSKEWVKISHTGVAAWDPANVSTTWIGQAVCAFADTGEDPEIELVAEIPLAELLVWLDEIEADCDSDGDTRYALFVATLREEALEKWGGNCQRAGDQAQATVANAGSVPGVDGIASSRTTRD